MPKIANLTWSGSFKRAFRACVLRTPNDPLFRARMRWFMENPFDVRLKTHQVFRSSCEDYREMAM